MRCSAKNKTESIAAPAPRPMDSDDTLYFGNSKLVLTLGYYEACSETGKAVQNSFSWLPEYLFDDLLGPLMIEHRRTPGGRCKSTCLVFR